MLGHRDLHALDEPLRLVPHHLLTQFELVVALHVHEDPAIARAIEELGGPAGDEGVLHALSGGERLLDDLSRLDVAQLAPHEGASLAGLDVLELQDLIDLAIEDDGDAVLELRRCNHACASDESWGR